MQTRAHSTTGRSRRSTGCSAAKTTTTTTIKMAMATQALGDTSTTHATTHLLLSALPPPSSGISTHTRRRRSSWPCAPCVSQCSLASPSDPSLPAGDQSTAPPMRRFKTAVSRHHRLPYRLHRERMPRPSSRLHLFYRGLRDWAPCARRATSSSSTKSARPLPCTTR